MIIFFKLEKVRVYEEEGGAGTQKILPLPLPTGIAANGHFNQSHQIVKIIALCTSRTFWPEPLELGHTDHCHRKPFRVTAILYKKVPPNSSNCSCGRMLSLLICDFQAHMRGLCR